ncbi:unnamed protein product, partial [marine sediment metagenome]
YTSGGIVEACANQRAIDGIGSFPESVQGVSELVLASQHKSLMKLNPKTGQPSKTMLYLGQTKKIASAMRSMLTAEFRSLELPAVPSIVCEVFSNRPSRLTASQIEEGTIVVTQAQWQEVVGPVFGQRARLLD